MGSLLTEMDKKARGNAFCEPRAFHGVTGISLCLFIHNFILKLSFYQSKKTAYRLILCGSVLTSATETSVATTMAASSMAASTAVASAESASATAAAG